MSGRLNGSGAWDPDLLCSYSTGRKLEIRDRWLGLLFHFFRGGIAVYVVIYTIILGQAYLKPGDVVGVVRYTLRQPSNDLLWPNGSAPYCLGSSGNYTDYSIISTSSYKYDGATGVSAPRYKCTYEDSRFVLPLTSSTELDAMFLPSRTTVIAETVSGPSGCSDLSVPGCTWNTVSQSNFYTADLEYFTVLLDHSMATNNGVSLSAADMQGVLLGQDGQPFDPCESYRNNQRLVDAGIGCPSFVNVGNRTAAENDIVPLRALLNAAGIRTLDEVSGTSAAVAGDTRRRSGVVLLVTVHYTNYYLKTAQSPGGTAKMDPSLIKYFYTVKAVQNSRYKGEQVYTPDNVIPGPNRTTYVRAGVRIVFDLKGQVGVFDFNTMLINFTTALGLLSVAVLVTDFIAFNVCKQKYIYRQYMNRKTVDMSDVRDAEDLAVLEKFKTKEDLIDPIPNIFVELLASRDLRMRRREELKAAQKEREQQEETKAALKEAIVVLKNQLAGMPTLPPPPPAAPADGGQPPAEDPQVAALRMQRTMIENAIVSVEGELAAMKKRKVEAMKARARGGAPAPEGGAASATTGQSKDGAGAPGAGTGVTAVRDGGVATAAQQKGGEVELVAAGGTGKAGNGSKKPADSDASGSKPGSKGANPLKKLNMGEGGAAGMRAQPVPYVKPSGGIAMSIAPEEPVPSPGQPVGAGVSAAAGQVAAAGQAVGKGAAALARAMGKGRRDKEGGKADAAAAGSAAAAAAVAAAGAAAPSKSSAAGAAAAIMAAGAFAATVAPAEQTTGAGAASAPPLTSPQPPRPSDDDPTAIPSPTGDAARSSRPSVVGAMAGGAVAPGAATPTAAAARRPMPSAPPPLGSLTSPRSGAATPARGQSFAEPSRHQSFAAAGGADAVSAVGGAPAAASAIATAADAVVVPMMPVLPEAGQFAEDSDIDEDGDDAHTIIGADTAMTGPRSGDIFTGDVADLLSSPMPAGAAGSGAVGEPADGAAGAPPKSWFSLW